MSDLFKIPSAQLVGNTSYGASLYILLTPNNPIHWSTDGGLTYNSTVPSAADISVLNQRVATLENSVTVISQDITNIETALLGATTSIQGLTTRMGQAETDIQGLTVRVDYLDESKAPLMTYVTDTVSTNPIIALFGGTHYTFTEVLEGLTFSSVEDSHYESEIQFTTGATFSFEAPYSLGQIGDETLSTGTSYIVNIRDRLMIVAEYDPGANVESGIWYYKPNGALDSTVYKGQLELSGATIGDGTLVVNDDAYISGEVLLNGFTSSLTVYGMVDSIAISDNTTDGAITVDGGSIGTITTNWFVGNVVMTSGTIDAIDNSHIWGEANFVLSGGYVGNIIACAAEFVEVSGTALISGLTANNANDGDQMGASVTINGGTVARLVMTHPDESTENPGELVITAGTVGLALATQTSITNGEIDATISQDATVINLPN